MAHLYLLIDLKTLLTWVLKAKLKHPHYAASATFACFLRANPKICMFADLNSLLGIQSKVTSPVLLGCSSTAPIVSLIGATNAMSHMGFLTMQIKNHD